MKILQICSARTIGGGEKHVADLANGLASRGQEVHVALRLSSGLRSELTALPDSNIHPLRATGPLNLLNAFPLARLIRERGVEVIHAHIAHDYLLAATAAGLAGRGRVVLTRHVLFPLSKVYRVTLRRVSRVIAVSEAVADSVRSANIFDAADIEVIHNGVHLARFKQNVGAREHTRRLFQAGSRDSYLVGMAGHLAPIKGPDEFIRAAAIVAGRRDDVTFVVAGEDKSRSGENRRRLERLVGDLGLGGRVHLPGWVDDVPTLLSALDLFVSPSRSEPFGLSIIEAMACGVPVVATKSEGAGEILEDGVTGLLVPPGDHEALAEAICALLDDGRRRAGLAARALEAVRDRFSLERMVTATEQLYGSVLGLRGEQVSG
jgi:glycosyltransferase involved in cell wall biosynthesis